MSRPAILAQPSFDQARFGILNMGHRLVSIQGKRRIGAGLSHAFGCEVREPPVREDGVRPAGAGEIAGRLLPYEQPAARGLPMRA